MSSTLYRVRIASPFLTTGGIVAPHLNEGNGIAMRPVACADARGMSSGDRLRREHRVLGGIRQPPRIGQGATRVGAVA
jgi:hypothetical protein